MELTIFTDADSIYKKVSLKTEAGNFSNIINEDITEIVLQAYMAGQRNEPIAVYKNEGGATTLVNLSNQ